MPSRTIPVLGYACCALLAGYLALVVVTVSMAAWQTNLAVEVYETEQDIARLESRYYAMVAQIDQTSPASRGLQKPVRVTYAAESPAPAFSLR